MEMSAPNADDIALANVQSPQTIKYCACEAMQILRRGLNGRS